MGETVALATVALIVHILAAAIWVGGMFFALLILRPAAGALEPGPRLALWLGVFERFFRWVIGAIALLLASGYAMIFGVYAGFRGIGLHVHLMQGLGIVMILLFFHLYFAPWRRFRRALAAQDRGAAAAQLDRIRAIVTVNLAQIPVIWHRSRRAGNNWRIPGR